MQTHNLKREHKRKFSAQVGRGGKRGKTSGRGTKGQKSRAGHKIRPEIRDIIMKLPKRRGFAFKSLEKKPFVINLQTLNNVFADGDAVNPTTLLEKKLVKAIGGKTLLVKILGDGEITKKITIEGCAVSKSVKEKVEKAGGMVKI
jgi:large subunit ribosomal protein L15